MKAFGKLSLILMLSFALVGCGTSNTANPAGKKSEETKMEKSTVEKPSELPVATITVENFGVIEAELYPHIAPNTVYNFIDLANSGFYNGLTIHRIVKNFVLQGGDPEGTGMGGPGYGIKGEFAGNHFENNLLHTEGVLSMARSSEPNSAGSQFFIVTKEAKNLDGQYAGFGKVIKGMDVVKQMEAVKTNGESPAEKVVMTSIKVDTKGITYPKPEHTK